MSTTPIASPAKAFNPTWLAIVATFLLSLGSGKALADTNLIWSCTSATIGSTVDSCAGTWSWQRGENGRIVASATAPGGYSTGTWRLWESVPSNQYVYACTVERAVGAGDGCPTTGVYTHEQYVVKSTVPSALALAAYSVRSGTLMNPGTGGTTADAWYCAQPTGCTASGTRDFWTANYPVEIVALAKALRNDVDLIYEYVRNNIEIVPIYGLQKGALGAIIDRSGTAFDQAQLMVELLRTSGYTAEYLAGTMTITGTQANDWLGTNNATALQGIFADGGIPATVTPTSGTATSVTLSHIWVRVNIGGTNYLFDPSFKPHAFTAGVNLATATGWNESSFISTSQSGMVTGTQSATSDTNPPVSVSLPYVRNLNGSGLKSTLTTYASNLVSWLRTNGYATKQLEDVIGRQDIVKATGQQRLTSLSGYTTQHTWSTHIPDVYRVKIIADFLNLDSSTALTNTLWADEVYGRRVFYESSLGTYRNYSVRLNVDGVQVGSSVPYTYSSPNAPSFTRFIRLSIDHPYAANNGYYMDLTGTDALKKKVDAVVSIFIVIGFGDVSDRLQAKFATEQSEDKILPESTFYNCGPSGCEPLDKIPVVAGESGLARAGAGWLAQYSRMAMIQTRLRGGVHQHHHTLGVAERESFLTVTDPNASPSGACSVCFAVGQGGTILDVDTAVSVNSKTASATDRQTLARSLAAASDALEGSQFEQVGDTASPASVAHRFDWGTANSTTMRYYLLTPTARSSSPFPSGPSNLPYNSTFPNAAKYLDKGYKVIVPDNSFLGPGRECEGPPCTSSQQMLWFERGGAFQAFAADGVTSTNVIQDALGTARKGGSAPKAPTYSAESNPEQMADLVKDKFKDRSQDLGVDMASGDFTYNSGEDVSVGNGDFPYRLSLERTFTPAESHSPGMGKGWTHNLDIRVAMSSDGMNALGQNSTLDAASSIVAIYATQQIYATTPGTDAGLLQRWVLAPLIQGWWVEKIRHNTVTHTAGSSSMAFVRLPDGTFNSPGGFKPSDGSSYWNLVQTGSPTGYGTTKWLYDSVSFTLTSPSKDVQTFAYWTRLNRNVFATDPHLWGPHHGWHITQWTFPQNVTLNFNYVPEDHVNFVDDHLSYVTNNIGERINFDFTATTDWDKCNITSVNDNLGHSTTFSCATNHTVTNAVGDVRKVVYGQSNCGVMTWTNRAIRPRCSPYVAEVFWPSSTTNAKAKLTYDEVGNVETYSDAVAVETPANRQPYRFYIADGLRAERKDPAGFFFTVYFDLWGRATQFIDEIDRTTNVESDGLRRTTKRTSPDGIITEFKYDHRGNTTEVKTTPKVTSPATTPGTLTVTAAYHSACGKVSQVTDARSNVTDWTYNSTTCRVTQVQQPSVLNPVTATNVRPTTTFSYTSVGLQDTITDPTGIVVDYNYDASWNRTARIVNPGGIAQSTNYGYDTVGNITSLTVGGNATTYLYDAIRRVTRMTGPAATCTISESAWTGGLVTKVRNAKICSPSFGNDTDWQVWLKSYTATDLINVETDPDGGTTDTDYDAVDRVEYTRVSASPSPTRVTRTEYDGAGQILKTYRAWGTSDQITYSEYGYDLDGHEDWFKDANGNLTDLSYDGYGRLKRSTYSDSSYEEIVAYDNNGNVEQKRNRSGVIVTMAYDALNRETTRTVPDNSGVPGDFSRTLTTSYDLASRKWDVTAAGQTLAHRYDNAGRLSTMSDSLLNSVGGGSTGNLSFTYNASSNRSGVTFTTAGATSKTLSYDYDAGDRLWKVRDGASVIVTNTYNPLSLLINKAYLDASSVGIAYESDDDLQSLAHSHTGGGLTLSYLHNGAHQIRQLTANDASYLAPQPSPTSSYTSNSLNQYTQVGPTTLTYDANGNLTYDGLWTYRYDEENRLRQAVSGGTTIDYAYDPVGRRRSKVVNTGGAPTTTYFMHDGPNELAELNSLGVRQRFYANGNGMDDRFAMYEDTGGATGWHFFHTNHQRSVLYTTRQGVSGVHASFHYGAYGESQDSPTGNPIRYTGRYFDAETGLYYYRTRYYSPRLGVFLQTDPVGVSADLNLYAYASGDAVNRIDPFGTTDEATNEKTVGCRNAMSYCTVVAGAAAVAKYTAQVGTTVVESTAVRSTVVAGAAASVADGPLPAGEVVGATAVLAVTAAVVVDKVATDVERMVERATVYYSAPAEQYTLRASVSTYYPNLGDPTQPSVFLQAGEVWKIGESTAGIARYPQSFYRSMKLTYHTEFMGTKLQARMQEKLKLGAYVLEHGTLPPGNRIFR